MRADLLPMLCAQGENYQDTRGFEGMKGEPKLDGWRCIIEVEEEGVRLYGGRNAEEYTGRVPYIEDELFDEVPPGTVLDGELVSTIDFGMVQSIMSTQEVHRPTKERPALKFYLFDVLKLGGVDMRKSYYESRRSYVEAFADKLTYTQPTILLDVTPANLELVLASGFEGLVVKAPKSSYVHGRSSSWKKIKPQKTSEGKIIGFEPGKADGRWDGKVGAFEVELLENGIVTTIKCKNDAMHEDATAHPEKWLGLIIEFKHSGGLMKSGKPRHPMFYRVRGDLVRTPADTLSIADTPVMSPSYVHSQVQTNGARMRNYGAMKDDKLLASIASLEAGEGEAYEKCISRGGNPADHLQVARNAASVKGLL